MTLSELEGITFVVTSDKTRHVVSATAELLVLFCTLLFFMELFKLAIENVVENLVNTLTHSFRIPTSMISLASTHSRAGLIKSEKQGWIFYGFCMVRQTLDLMEVGPP